MRLKEQENMNLVQQKIAILEKNRKQENIEQESVTHITSFLDTLTSPTVLEIGTFNGYSALILSQHAKLVISIEKDKQRYEEALQNTACAENIRLVLGDAKEALNALPVAVDVALIDGMKSEYADYLALILPKMRVGGCIFIDNTISHRDKLDTFFDYLEQEQLDWEELGLGKGLILIKL